MCRDNVHGVFSVDECLEQSPWRQHGVLVGICCVSGEWLSHVQGVSHVPGRPAAGLGPTARAFHTLRGGERGQPGPTFRRPDPTFRRWGGPTSGRPGQA
eukprot:gene24209-biopygen10419